MTARLDGTILPVVSSEPQAPGQEARRRRSPLAEVIDLIVENSPESLAELKRRHRMHALGGIWPGSGECRACNAGDWLLVWRTAGDIALMQRTGTHGEIFR